METISGKLRELVVRHPTFTGQVCLLLSPASITVGRLYQSICQVLGPKIVVVLYRHNVGTLGELRSFLLGLTNLCAQADNTILCVCFPIPSQHSVGHFESSQEQVLALVDLQQQTLGYLRVIELFHALRQPPLFNLQIPGVTRWSPHSITPMGCSRIAFSLFSQLLEIAASS